jgi:hypothetical protein
MLLEQRFDGIFYQVTAQFGGSVKHLPESPAVVALVQEHTAGNSPCRVLLNALPRAFRVGLLLL